VWAISVVFSPFYGKMFLPEPVFKNISGVDQGKEEVPRFHVRGLVKAATEMTRFAEEKVLWKSLIFSQLPRDYIKYRT